MEIPAISLWQPWATLIQVGAKKIETRSWTTRYRGPLAIHAAKKRLGDIPGMLDIFRDNWGTWATALGKAGCPLDQSRRLIGCGGLPLGAIVAVVDLVDCVQITDANVPGWPERAFGDYTPGRFAWMLENVTPLAEPIPWRGAQGLFNVTLPDSPAKKEGGVA